MTAQHATDDALETLFISDLHLSPQRPALTRLFIDFLEQRAPVADRLFILGDLFDAWIGDDDDPLPEVRHALGRLVVRGTDCAIMHGNRDFLLGGGFASLTGCRLITDPSLIELDRTAVLLMHGDLLCTDDLAYQRFRRRVRNPIVQQLFLWSPLSRRRQIAADYRQRSAEAMAAKPAEIMDVNATEVVKQMRRFGAYRLIHGHTHRPQDHQLQIAGRPAVRHVLADWKDDRGELLVHQQSRWRREAWLG
jgi:UDP-2,3-diacylglucosamine hydrolase